ncbi:MAG: CehA/McbA family metallohydrolase [Chloroflexi bacterium]|nr:CehA/McbA family metallohydrolase [Chloroflexota bacterium]
MSWISPFSLPGHWYRGNLHTHTTQSDGRSSPEAVCAWYRAHGYDFIAITDHWVYTPGTRSNTGDWITVSGVELHGPGYHMLTVGTSGLPDMALASDPNKLAAEVLRLGGLPFFAHPYWTGQTYDSLIATPGILGVEVYNSGCDVTLGLGYARTEWDESLSAGAHFTGLAVDDGHGTAGEEGLGWVMVKAPSLEEKAVLEALRRGTFYSTTGPLIDDLRLVHTDDGQPALFVRCSPCRYITFYGKMPTGARFRAKPGTEITTAVMPLRENQLFMRVECEDQAGRVAWSNPVYIADVLNA